MKNQANVVIKKESHSRGMLSGIFRVLSLYVNQAKCLFVNNLYVEDPRVLRTAKSGMTTNLMGFTLRPSSSRSVSMRDIGAAPGFTARGFISCRHPEFISGSSRYNNKMLKQVQHDDARGFTLIELLVVVLIIGILAAVALPQYQLAVKKAKFTQLRSVADTLTKAARVSFLSTGQWPQRFSELDLSLPEDMQVVETKNTGGARSSCLECAVSEDFYCCLLFPRVNYNGGSINCATTSYQLIYSRTFADGSGKPQDSYACGQLSGKENFCQKLPNATRVLGTSLITPDGWTMSIPYEYYSFE